MREAIIDAARECLGTPFRHQGRVPGKGLDCVGLLLVVASKLSIPVLDRLDYDRRPAFGALEKQLVASGLSIVDCADVKPGDVGLFRIERAPQHVAILSPKTMMIHAYLQARQVVEHRMDDLWQERLVGVYRFPGVK